VYSKSSSCPPIALDRLIAGIVKNHLSHLFTDLLPVVNVEDGLFPHHDGSALIFKNRENGFRIVAFSSLCFASNRSK
jgi:hypothetical protein